MNIFIDGTWTTKLDHSNIYRLYEDLGGYYFPGPGTKSWFLDKILGGLGGLGTQDIVDKAFQTYIDNYEGGPINIFGFSRGAAAARMLAAKLSDKGGKVTFLGCFDTVGAFGIPLWFWPFTIYDDMFTDTEVNANVRRAAHAVALDEPRATFTGTPMKKREGIVSKGFHGDHPYVGFSRETYLWMRKQFKNR